MEYEQIQKEMGLLYEKLEGLADNLIKIYRDDIKDYEEDSILLQTQDTIGRNENFMRERHRGIIRKIEHAQFDWICPVTEKQATSFQLSTYK